MARVISPPGAVEVLADLRDRGYALGVYVRTDEVPHPVGAMYVTYADRLRVRGPMPVPDDLADAIRANKPELMAAAAVADPPVPWVRTLVERYRAGRITLGVLAANLAAFVGLGAAEDGPRIEAVVCAALDDSGSEEGGAMRWPEKEDSTSEV